VENLDSKTVEGFGKEWKEFNQKGLSAEERKFLYDKYFNIFPWDSLPPNASGIDVGCGSGRWAVEVAPRVGKLICADASGEALEVAKSNLSSFKNCHYIKSSVDRLPVEDTSLDFAYSLGVLHHIPNTMEGIRSCVNTLKSGAPFLVYLYYRFDNKPFWYRMIWQVSELFRAIISKTPFFIRKQLCFLMAALVYYPLAKIAKLFEKFGFVVDNFPLSSYRDVSFYSMKTDALDRFGTRLEQRFTKQEIEKMLIDAGLENILFSDSFPFWVALGYKK